MMKFKLRFVFFIALTTITGLVLINLLNTSYTKPSDEAKHGTVPRFMFASKCLNLKKHLIDINPKRQKVHNDSLTEFYEIHEKNLFSSNGKNPCNISFNEASKQNGYANRLYSLFSSLLVAILTDSALLVDWPHIHHYIQPPINIFLQNISTLNARNYNSVSETIHVSILKASSQAWLVNKNMSMLMNKSFIPVDRHETTARRYYYKREEALFME